MVDQIRKNLRRLLPGQQKQLLETIKRIKENELIGLDLVKLAGSSDVYRVRKGTFRIIFLKMQESENVIIAVERRSETTYGDY